MNKDNNLKKINENGLNFWVDSKAYNHIEMVHHFLLVCLVDMIIEKTVYSSNLTNINCEADNKSLNVICCVFSLLDIKHVFRPAACPALTSEILSPIIQDLSQSILYFLTKSIINLGLSFLH